MAWRNCGQSCALGSRVLVERPLYDRAVEMFRERAKTVRVGMPLDEASRMGPQANEAQLKKTLSYVEIGKNDGAELVTGGRRIQTPELAGGYFIEPTVFAGVDNGSTIAREEIFGPVLSVIPADGEEQAIAIANDTIYGLNASVFTNDPERAYAVGRRLRAGTVGHNAFKTDFSIAFGGFKQSGIGREGGIEGMYPYLEAKTMILDQRVPKAT